MKQGANFQDRNRIRELAAAGLTAQEISDEVKVVVACVKGFLPPKPKPKAVPKPKTKPASKED